MTSPRSANITEVDLDPSELAHQTHAITNYFNAIKTHEANKVHEGGLAAAPTTASSQLTGAAGVTEWRINMGLMLVAVGGVMAEIAADADKVLHDTTVLLTAVGKSCKAAIVAKNVAGTVTVVAVKGLAADTADALLPTDANLQAAVGAGNAWVLLAECLITRSGDTAVTQAQNNLVRPQLGVNVDPTFAAFTG